METHVHDWLSLLLRWTHVIVGVAWIGASFYFNWLENRLRSLGKTDDIADDLWAVQSGGFYFLRKLAIAPQELPAQLNWFKRAAYTSWITGILLLAVIYYWQANTYMVDPNVSEIPERLAIVAGMASIALSWLFYDLLCRSKISHNELLMGFLVFAWFALVTWALSHLLNGRAAYIHVGAAIGTIMAANVFHMISPAQKDLVKAVTEGHSSNSKKGAMALQRSRHNSYFALPVLFIMISSHYPMTYAHPMNWFALLLVAAVAVAIRHYFNLQHKPGKRALLWVSSALIVVALVYITIPRPKPVIEDFVYVPASIGMVRDIIQQRCQQCHSAMPQFAGFTTSPRGIEFDSREQVLEYSEKLYNMTVTLGTMPPENVTRMTEEERQVIATWYAMLEYYLKK